MLGGSGGGCTGSSVPTRLPHSCRPHPFPIRINGVPACANKKLLTDILRGEWGFEGYVVSDEGAVELIMLGHRYTRTFLETAVGEQGGRARRPRAPRSPDRWSPFSPARQHR